MSEYPSDWTQLPLRECGTWYSGGTPAKNVEEYWNGDIPWISAKSMYEVYVGNSDDKVTELGARNGTRLVPKDSLLILVRGSMLFKRVPICITSREVTFNQDVKALVVNNKVYAQFLLYYLIAHENYLLSTVSVTGMGAGKLSTDILENFPIHLPPLDEQRKIAAILGTWDKAIGLVEQLIEALQARKKGLMQKLLTGEVRFAEFEGEEWEEVQLKDVVTKKEGLRRGPFGGALKKAFFVEEGYKVYEQKNAIQNNLLLGDYYISEEKFSELKSFEVLVGDFLVSCSGTIGKIIQVPENAPKGVINQALLRIRTNSEIINASYFKQYFESDTMQKTIIDNTQGGAMQNIVGMDIFKNIYLPLPQLSEQIFIANILELADEEKYLVQQILTELQEQKRGLMQALLTGQVRV